MVVSRSHSGQYFFSLSKRNLMYRASPRLQSQNIIQPVTLNLFYTFKNTLSVFPKKIYLKLLIKRYDLSHTTHNLFLFIYFLKAVRDVPFEIRHGFGLMVLDFLVYVVL
jgi:hypothetical protein